MRQPELPDLPILKEPLSDALPVTMWILPLLGYVGIILGFAFLTLAIGTSFRHGEPTGRGVMGSKANGAM